jgi:hypothetical protein
MLVPEPRQVPRVVGIPDADTKKALLLDGTHWCAEHALAAKTRVEELEDLNRNSNFPSIYDDY